METNKKTDDEIIEGIMNGLSEETSKEAEQETETQVETQPEAQAEVVQEAETETKGEAIDQEVGGGEIQEETLESTPATKNQVNKVEGFKAFRKELKEKDDIIKNLKEKLDGKPEEKAKAETTEAPSDETLNRIAEMLDKTPDEVKAAFKVKDAEKAGMTVEAFDKFNEMNKRMDSYEAEKAYKAAEKSKTDLADAIDGLIEKTGIATEEDLNKFFVKAKDMGFDLTKNPNSNAMVTVFNGMDKTGFKETLEQEVLLQIKNGEVPVVDSQAQEPEKIAKQKQQQKKFNADYKSWAAQADDI